MWLFVFLLSLIPASLGCPEMVTSPTELVVGLGSCLYISCHYDLCKVGSDAELRKLRWIHHPQYDTKQQEFTGKKVSELSGTPGNTKGDCSLILPHIRADDAGVYGLRLVGEPNRRYSKGWLWMHYVTINVTDTPPAPHLWLDPDPITQGRRTTFGCWVPPACPKDSPTLTWEGPITKTPGVHMDSWTPPATVTTHPVIGTLLAFDPFWYHDETTVKCILRGSDGKTITQASWQLQVNYAPRNVQVDMTPSSPVHEGQGVTLSCRDSAKPPSHTYTWSLDGRTLPHHTAHVLLEPIQAADGGSYSCQATNVVGTTQSPPTVLQVYYPPKAVKVLQTPRGPVVAWGGLVRLQCQIGAAEPAKFTISWFKNGQELPVPSSELLLPGPEPVDAATYACQARNEAGVTRSPPFILDVRFGPQGVELVPDPSQRVQEMSDVILRCHADASPPPNVFEWFWDGRLLGQTPKGLWVLRAVGTQASGRYRCRVTNDIATTDSPDVIITVYYSTTTILRRTFLGVGVGLSILLVLGTLGCFLRRWWRRQMAAHEEPMVEPSRTFFLRNKKPLMPGSTRPPLGPDDSDTISYASLLSPPGSGSVPRLRGDTVVYTVLKRNEGAAKATEGPDYENVPPGSSNRDRDRDRDRDGTLVYAALALSSPGPPRGQAGDVGDTVEYAALRH
ncbi:B-cell receptor CD22 isoform X2 [Grus americana]|uniref:B-cell receptor CD22 isoform X2 n=1 Tax=Grus americana TaxID=9117 RepID=UPI0024081294|nr:B-cell receptor CD22 isoform X2 [Grus americana]